MEKKKMTNKKKFWIGMSSLAAIGAITATVAYFSSTHNFNKDTLKSLGYSATAEKVLDSEAAKNMYNGQTIDAQVSVTNDGEIPVLTRIYYTFSDKNEANAQRGVKLTDENLSPFVAGFYAEAEGNKFGYNESDGYYYYQGILTNGQTAKHLKTISLTGLNDSSPDSIKIEVKGRNAEGSNVDYTDTISNVTQKTGERSTYTFNSHEKELQVVIETTQATDFNGNALIADRLTSASDVASAWNYPQ